MKYNNYNTIGAYKREVLFEIKYRETKDHFYVSLWLNNNILKEYKGKDFYKLKDKIIEYARYTYNVYL